MRCHGVAKLPCQHSTLLFCAWATTLREERPAARGSTALVAVRTGAATDTREARAAICDAERQCSMWLLKSRYAHRWCEVGVGRMDGGPCKMAARNEVTVLLQEHKHTR